MWTNLCVLRVVLLCLVTFTRSRAVTRLFVKAKGFDPHIVGKSTRLWTGKAGRDSETGQICVHPVPGNTPTEFRKGGVGVEAVGPGKGSLSTDETKNHHNHTSHQSADERSVG